MLRFAFFAIFLAAICANLVIGGNEEASDPIVKTVNNVTEYLKENPHVKLLEFETTEIPNSRSTINRRHTLGRRTQGN